MAIRRLFIHHITGEEQEVSTPPENTFFPFIKDDEPKIYMMNSEGEIFDAFGKPEKKLKIKIRKEDEI